MRKGLAEIDVVVVLALITISTIILFGLVFPQLGSLETLRAGACERYAFLPFCGGQQYNITTTEYLKARHSVLSARCAADSVTAGKKEQCVDELNAFAKANSYETSIQCGTTDNKFTCKVLKFSLPQYNANSKFIQGHGDPQFLAYWSTFPPEIENSWSSLSPAGLDLANIIIGFRSIGFIVTRGAGKGLYLPMAMKSSIIADQIGVLMPAARSIGSLIADELSPGAKEILGDISDTTKLVAEFLKSKQEKYVSSGSGIALKSPYKAPEYFPLKTDEPVLFKYDNFFAVSPCTANLEMRETIVECERYRYNSDTKSIQCINPSEAAPMTPLNECRGTDIKRNRMAFTQDDFIPGRLQQLFEGNAREDVVFYEDIGQNRFIVTDTVTGISFAFRPMFMDAPATTKYILYEISIVDEGERKYFGIIDGKYEGNYISISASASCERHGDPDSEDINDPPSIKCDFASNPSVVLLEHIELVDIECPACSRLAEHLGRMEEIRFRRLKIIVEDEDGHRYSNWLNKFGFWYRDARSGYYLTYYDSNKDKYAETLAVTNNKAEGIENIDTISPDSKPKTKISFSDEPGLTDGKPDHKFETVSITGCRTDALITSMEREKTGKTNFCYPEGVWYYAAASYLPEIGAALGTAIGGGLGAYTTGGFGIVTGAWEGMTWGYAVGGAFGGAIKVGQLFRIIPRNPGLWPGKNY